MSTKEKLVSDAFIMSRSAEVIPLDPSEDPYQVTTKMRGHAERHMMHIRDIYESDRLSLLSQIAERKWISVHEALPGEGVRVMVHDSCEPYHPRVALLWTMNGIRFWHLDTAKGPASMTPYEVFTHWQALPPPLTR